MKMVLIGGGAKARYIVDKESGEISGRSPIETFAIDEYFIKMIDKKKPKILYLPTANEKYDRKFYFEKYQKEMYSSEAGIKEYFEDNFNVEVSTLYLFVENPSDEEIKAKIAEADGIFIGGGTTRAMLAKWKERGVDTLLLEAMNANKPISGVSAGAICWFEYACTDSSAIEKRQDNGTLLEVIPCLGILQGLAVPHCITETRRMPFAKECLQGDYKDVKAVCIDDYAAVVVDGDKIGYISSQDGSKVVYMSFDGQEFQETELTKFN